MNIGLTLIGALLFLAPGLACVLVQARTNARIVRRPILSSGSVAVIGIVPAASAVLHSLFMFIALANDSLPSSLTIELPFEPNPYTTYFALIREKPVSIIQVAWALFAMLPISVGSALTYLVLRKSWRKIKQLKHPGRWPEESELEYLLRQAMRDDDTALAASVFIRNSSFVEDGGWVGLVDDLTLASDGELVSITLIQPIVFDFVEWDKGASNLLNSYREHDDLSKYETMTIPSSEIVSVGYFLSLPPIHDLADNPSDLEAVQAEETATDLA